MRTKTRQQTSEATKHKLEHAAHALFMRRGFNAVGLRDLAAAAGVSLGAVYNHYASKDELFAAILDRLYTGFAAATEPLAQFLATAKLPDDIERFGEVMRDMVERHREYLTLVYVDIAEFGGKHARPHYKQLAARFRDAVPAKKHHALPAWADPGVVFTVIYMQFANHYVVEKLLGAKGYLGLSETESIRAITKLFTYGIAPRKDRS